MVPSQRITKALVERAPIPNKGQTFIRDDELKGFALRVTAHGAKSFIWEGRINGKNRRITIGQFPDKTVVAARQKALEMRTAIGNGEDPTKESRAKRAERTFGSLVDEYLERYAKVEKRSWRQDDSVIRNHIPKSWLTRKASDISREEVIRLKDDVRKNSGPYAANHVIRLLRAMFNLARNDWGYLIEENPAARVKQFDEEKRDRFLSPEELRRVSTALADEPNEYWRAYFALSLLLGTRRSELLSARWQHVDFERRTLRIPETKAGRPHTLPLPNAALAILESLPSRAGVSEWLFPGDGSTGHLAEPKKAWDRVRRQAGVRDVRIHDLRRTLGSWLAASGYSLPLIGKTLNHSNESTTAIYARLQLDPVREALERNAEAMFGVVAGPKPALIETASTSETAAPTDGERD
jgi:integrase